MHTTKISIAVLVFAFLSLASCKRLREEDKIFHAGPVESGVGVIYFGLYKENKYQFCDGDFMDPGCYTGDYSLSGDTITLYDLRNHTGIPTNRFLVRRYKEMDSTYWQWKYPDYKGNWQQMRQSDLLRGAEGDIFPLDNKREAVLSKYRYFLIRYDKL
jgi:hypothetical protein